MSATLTLLDLAGAIALLLWGLHMVQSGVTRAFGANLRRVLGSALRNRAKAFLAGLGATAVLQSSTATGLMATSFAANGLLDLVPALALMLGANIGTTLIVQAVSFDIGKVAPLLILLGVLAFRRGDRTRTRDLGRVSIGLGLMLLALEHLLALIRPAEDIPSLRLLLGSITQDPLLDILLGAALTWASHSSVAIVLLAMSFATQGVIPPHAAFAIVLGANLGSAINPVLEGTPNDNPAARRLPWGNLINRLIGCALALPLLGPVGIALATHEPDAARAVADFHTAFNIVLAALFFPLLPVYARLLRRLLPERAAPSDPSSPAYLDPGALEAPSVALANAARETLRIADAAEAMLRGTLDVLETGDRKRVAEIRRMDDVLDRLNDAVKRYLAAIPPEALGDEDAARAGEILAFTTNLEHAGDIVVGSLLTLAAKKIKRKLAFSVEGRAEIGIMFERLIGNVRLASAVFMTGAADSARSLLAEKAAFRELESDAAEKHFERLRQGRIESVETSALHLDVLRDLKRINSHLAAASYSVLEGRGELLRSRLKADDV
jgi:phosphate:Na+ symporter